MSCIEVRPRLCPSPLPLLSRPDPLTGTEFAYFFFHTLLRTAAIKRTGASLSTPAELALGAAAGALAQIFTIPVAVIATRQQLWIAPPGATGKAAREPSLLETAKEIVRDGGLTALWTGLKPGLVLTVNPAITYGVFERGKTLLLEGEGRAGGKLGVGEAFWLGVFSKTLATIVTYPYIFVSRVGSRSYSVSFAGAPRASGCSPGLGMLRRTATPGIVGRLWLGPRLCSLRSQEPPNATASHSIPHFPTFPTFQR